MLELVQTMTLSHIFWDTMALVRWMRMASDSKFCTCHNLCITNSDFQTKPGDIHGQITGTSWT